MSESGDISGSGAGETGDVDHAGDTEEMEPGVGQEPRSRRSLFIVAGVVVGLIAVGVAVALWAQSDDSPEPVDTVAEGSDGDDSSGEHPDDEPAVDDGSADEPADDQPAETTPESPDEQVEPDEPVETAAGSFVSLDYQVTGEAKVLEQPDGGYTVVLEDLNSDDGPDLYVYLSTNPVDGPGDAFKDDFADLGPLQGLTGTQEYDVPADVDPTRFATVVIWCEQVSAPFGAVDLGT